MNEKALIKKGLRVLDSCETIGQLSSAIIYIYLIGKRLGFTKKNGHFLILMLMTYSNMNLI